MRENVDVVVVGAGSSGSVVVRRLVDAGLSVTLLEAGGPDTNPAIHDPAGVFQLWDVAEDWGIRTVPQPGAAGRRLHLPRGRVLGGSYSLNGMITVRGDRRDYDGWAARGATGWSWDEVLPYFKRLEDHDRGASDAHGVGGPIDVVSRYQPTPIHAAVVAAAVETGIPANDDPNAGDPTGVGLMELTLRDGKRLNSWIAYVRPVLDSPLLEVVTGARVRRVVVEGGRAAGVEFEDASGTVRTVRADRQVVLSSGALGTPEVLLRSGIGPAAVLAAAGVPVVADLPGVGENLQDHLLCPVVLSTTRPTGPPAAGLPWAQSHWFARSRPELEVCDTQPIVFGAPLYGPGQSGPEHGLTMHGGLVRPASRGRVTLAADGTTEVDLGALSAPEDLEALAFSVAQVRQVAQAPALAEWGVKEEYPGPLGDDPAQLREYVRRNVGTYHHQTGTARMGGDGLAVVDPRLAVHGVAGLRVVDASVMPDVPSGNTNVPCLMIAEKGAELLLADVG